MTMPLAILSIALAAQILPAPDALRWERLIDESAGPSFIEPASLTRDGDVVRFLNRSDILVDRGDGVRMLVLRVAINCRRGTIGLVEGDVYGEGGRLLRSIPTGPDGIEFSRLNNARGTNQVFARVCGAARSH